MNKKKNEVLVDCVLFILERFQRYGNYNKDFELDTENNNETQNPKDYI